MLVLAFVSCGTSGSQTTGAAGGHDHGSMNMEGEVPGESADAAEADREIEVTANDDLRFEPASIEVSAGEIITFIVRNVGDIDHEFVLGDEAYQEMHASDMEESDHMSDTDNAVTVAPGETKEVTWRFTEAGEVLFGCHEAGHYDAGMIGTIEVTSS